MSFLTLEARASKIFFDEYNFWVILKDGRQLSIPLSYFPRLSQATTIQREMYEISGDGIGLHWDELDEDINVPALLSGKVSSI